MKCSVKQIILYISVFERWLCKIGEIYSYIYMSRYKCSKSYSKLLCMRFISLNSFVSRKSSYQQIKNCSLIIKLYKSQDC